jgi:MHS family proline/betaine transporter-like MFS transporter
MSSSDNRVRAVVAASIGNMLEWYDFTVYALFAAYVGRSFFPVDAGQAAGSGPAATNLVQAFLAFGLGFVVRPLGALLIGSYGDRAGRKAALTLTILLMAAGTGTIALAPTYTVIGVGAPLLLLLGRVLQGFSAGGEVGSATAFLAESAPPGRRGAVTSWLEASMGMSNILGALTAFSVTALLTVQQVEAWGWRIPFLFGLLILPAGLYLRRTLHETDSFEAERVRRTHAAQPARAPLIEIFTHYPRELLIGFGVCILWATAVYVLIVYLPVYVQLTFGYSPRQAFGASLVANFAFVACCVIFGSLSDRIGRRTALLISAAALFVGALPLFLLLQAHPTTSVLIAVLTAFCVLVASFVGVAPAAMSEVFPTGVRSTGTSIVYNGAFTVFGGFAPAILTWLTHRPGGSVLAPAWYVMSAAVVGSIAIPFLPSSRVREPRLVDGVAHSGSVT